MENQKKRELAGTRPQTADEGCPQSSRAREGPVETVTFELNSEGLAEKWLCPDRGP